MRRTNRPRSVSSNTGRANMPPASTLSIRIFSKPYAFATRSSMTSGGDEPATFMCHHQDGSAPRDVYHGTKRKNHQPFSNAEPAANHVKQQRTLGGSPNGERERISLAKTLQNYWAN